MKNLFFPMAFVTLLAGCATPDVPESVRATQAMTDIDGVPISPGGGSALGIGIGGWGHWGGIGAGFGIGW
jgi:hypothetical protein